MSLSFLPDDIIFRISVAKIINSSQNPIRFCNINLCFLSHHFKKSAFLFRFTSFFYIFATNQQKLIIT